MNKQDLPSLFGTPFIDTDVPVRRIDISSAGQGIWWVWDTVDILGAEQLEGFPWRGVDLSLWPGEERWADEADGSAYCYWYGEGDVEVASVLKAQCLPDVGELVHRWCCIIVLSLGLGLGLDELRDLSCRVAWYCSVWILGFRYYSLLIVLRSCGRCRR